MLKFKKILLASFLDCVVLPLMVLAAVNFV